MNGQPFKPGPGAAFLAYTRKHGWVVVVAIKSGSGLSAYEASFAGLVGYTRPGGGRIVLDDILAMAPLPPVPQEAA